MTQSLEINELAAALSLAQANMKPAEMNATNPYFKTNYADLGSIIAVAREPLAANGLSFTQLVNSPSGTISVETILMHKSGQWISTIIALPLQDKGSRTMAQDAGAVLTYLRRYSLAAILGIYAEQDTDGNDGQKPKKEEAKKDNSQNDSTVPAPKSEMSLEMAEAVTNREGVKYGDIATDTLSHMHRSILKSLKENHLSPEDKEQHELKRDAIATIMAHRAKNNGG